VLVNNTRAKIMKKVKQMRIELPLEVNEALKDLAAEEMRSLQSQVLYILKETAETYISAKERGLERFK
jgi:hypothetical protein